MSAHLESKLPRVGTTIFSLISHRAAERGALNLGQGFPDFPVPERLRDLLAEAMADGHNQYAPMQGVPALREAVAAKVATLYGRAVDPGTEVTVTSGATEALFDAVQAVVHPGDDVILLDPAYDAYEPAVTLAGGRAVRIPLAGPAFSVDWTAVEDALSPRTRLVIVNSPHNPSGAILDAEDLEILAGLLRDTRILVLSDEVYEHIVFGAVGHLSLLGHPELAERSFVVSSFGKTYHCTGWKVGYCVAPAGLTAELRKLHQYVTFATMTPAQVAIARFMTEHPEHHRELAGFYRTKRDRFNEHLEAAGFRVRPARGTYFQVADYSRISDAADTEFAEYLIDAAGVAAVPISVFHAIPPRDQRLIRFCFAKDNATLDAAGERLRKLGASV